MRHFFSSILFPIIIMIAVLLPIGGTFLFTRTDADSTVKTTNAPTFKQIEITSTFGRITEGEEKKFLAVPEELATYIKRIEKNSPDILEVELTTNQIAVLSSDSKSQPTELKRLLAIIQGFQFDTIEEKIVEIDVRYKLPVLRTTKSSEQIRSEFSQASEDVNKEQSEVQTQTNQIEAQDNNDSSVATQATIQE